MHSVYVEKPRNQKFAKKRRSIPCFEKARLQLWRRRIICIFKFAKKIRGPHIVSRRRVWNFSKHLKSWTIDAHLWSSIITYISKNGVIQQNFTHAPCRPSLDRHISRRPYLSPHADHIGEKMWSTSIPWKILWVNFAKRPKRQLVWTCMAPYLAVGCYGVHGKQSWKCRN